MNMNKLKKIYNMALVLGCAIIFNTYGCGDKHSKTPNSQKNNILMDESKAASYKVLGSDLTRREVITVTFLDSLDEITDDAWDVSADDSGKVMAWTKWRDNGGYDLYVEDEGNITANKNSSGLFSGYINVEHILFNNNFHTENTQDMSAMFLFCGNLKELDVSHFDTSNVTDMNGMFCGCSSLGELDVSHFDTSNVIDMKRMFYGCRKLVKLDVSGFDTSNVTDVQAMFGKSDNLTNLNVSNFDPDLVKTMYWPL